MSADVLLINGRVFRGSGPGDHVPAGSEPGPVPSGAPTALAVRGGRVTWVGRDDEGLREWRGPRTDVVDASGGLIMAGFEDAHAHLIEGARSLGQVDLSGLGSLREIQAAIAGAAAARPGDPWVLGAGWLYASFPGGMPDRRQLDAVVPDRPARILSYDGHTAWVNSCGLRIAGITADTPDPSNGAIDRDATGEPTGVLKEEARSLVERLVPVPSQEEDVAALRRVIPALHEAGITAVQDAWVTPADLRTWQIVLAEPSPLTRFRLALPMEPGLDLVGWRRRLEDYRSLAEVHGLAGVTGILKGFVDGVVEARTAAMLDPYVDDSSSGRSPWDAAELDAFVAEADRAGWQVELHAIGDRAVRMALDAFERAGAARAHRHRVEHIETIHPDDLGRFGRLGVIASMQPLHASPTANLLDAWAGNIGPERALHGWPWASIHRAGGWIAFGSDWPVVPYDPFQGLHVAVTRRTGDGLPPGGLPAGERMGIGAALSAFTLGSAFAGHADARRGTPEPGFDADLVVLDRDLLAEDPSAVLHARVQLTMIGGRIVHRRTI